DRGPGPGRRGAVDPEGGAAARPRRADGGPRGRTGRPGAGPGRRRLFRTAEIGLGFAPGELDRLFRTRADTQAAGAAGIGIDRIGLLPAVEGAFELGA